MNTISALTARDPFADRYGAPLPRDLAQSCADMSWDEFLDNYAPLHGHIAIDRWRELTGHGMPVFEAHIRAGAVTTTASVAATGPVAALTSMLHGVGCGIEILAFHQRPVADGIATFLQCERNGRRHWAFAIHGDGSASALAAAVAGANILANG